MKLGFSTACFYPKETETVVSEIAAGGFSCCEAFLEADCEYTPDFLKRFQEELARYGVQVLTMHPFGGFFELLLFSEYARRRRDAEEVFRKALRAAQILGASCYNLHGDKNILPPERVDFAAYGRRMSELAEIAADYGVTLAWENVVRNSSRDPEFLRRTLPYITSDNLGFTFDYKQARRAGFPPEAYLSVMKDRLVNVHISDYTAQEDCAAPGNGVMDFPAEIDRLRGIGYDGTIIVELYNCALTGTDPVGRIYRFLSPIVSK